MPRYEKGTAFIEIELDGSVVTTRTGGPDEAPSVDRTTHEGPALARWEHDKQIALAIEAGFRPAIAVPDADEPSHEGMETAISSEPDEVDAYLVYGDWLQSRGEPRGELICVQHAISEQRRLGRTQQEKFFSERAMRLERAELLLLLLHRERFFGPVLSRVHNVDTQRYLVDFFHLQWHLGFIRRAELPHSPRRDGVDLRFWEELLRTSSARFLRQVQLDWADAGQLISTGAPPTLEHLELVFDSWWPPEREEDTLRADGGYTSLDEAVGDPAQFSEEVSELLRPLLSKPPSPRLKELVLRRCPFARRLLDLLASSPLLSQLRTLDLSRGRLTDDDLPQLLQQIASFRHLQRLDLSRNRFSRRSRARLSELGGWVVI